MDKEKKRLLIATVMYNTHPVVYSSHLNMMYRAGRDMPPEWDCAFYGPVRTPIDAARNQAAEFALQIEAKYLLFYDDDMYLNPTVVKKLVDLMEEDEGERNVIMAKCFIRGYPYDAMIFKHTSPTELAIYKDWEKDVPENGLLEVDAVGCACTIVDVNLFRNMTQPYFMTGKLHTEDVYFCLKAKQELENVHIFMYDKMEAGHLMDRPILTSDNRGILQDLDKKGLNNIWLPKEEEPEPEFSVYENPLLEVEKCQQG